MRGWRLMLLLAVVGALLVMVLPSSSGVTTPPSWGATALVTTVGGKGSVNISTLTYDAANIEVLEAAAKGANFDPPKSYVALIFTVSRSGNLLGKGVHVPALALHATGAPNAKVATNWANSYADALGTYVQQGLSNTYQQNLCKANQNIQNLGNELDTIDTDISQEQANPGSVAASDIPAPPSPDTGQCSSSGSSSDDGFVRGSSARGAVLDASSTPTTAATPTKAAPSAATTTTTTPPAKTGSGSGSGSQSLQDQAKQDPVLAELESLQSVTNSELNAYTSQLSQLALQGVPKSGYVVLLPASRFTAALAKVKHGLVSSSLLSHSYVKGFAGLIAGALAAAAIIALVELTDKSLRSVVRAEAAFGFPVVAELPLPDAPQVAQPGSTPARLDAVLQPFSALAEAYRRLRTTLILEPLAAELAARLIGYANGNVANGNVANGNGSANGHRNGNSDEAGAKGYRNGRRQVVLVVSPTREPTRPAVAANLAAVLAESGKGVLVISMGEFAWHGQRADLPALGGRGEEITASDVAPSVIRSAVRGVSGFALDRLLVNRAQVVTHGPAVVNATRELADWVIVEAPPLLRSQDALGLLPAVDVVLVVAEFALTTADSASKAAALLRKFEAPVLGVVMTNVRPSAKGTRGAVAQLEAAPVVLHPEPPTVELRH